MLINNNIITQQLYEIFLIKILSFPLSVTFLISLQIQTMNVIDIHTAAKNEADVQIFNTDVHFYFNL